jgi:hypothetical protein
LAGRRHMTPAQARQTAQTILGLDAIDLYIISEELKDAFEDELMRKDVKSWEAMALILTRIQWIARRTKPI